MSMHNVKTIQEIYGAFGAGDVAAIAERCAPETQWSFAAATPDEVPWHAPVDGRDGLPAFFNRLGGSVEFERFEPREFAHCGPHVIVDVHLAYTVRGTGVRVEMDQVHWWTLDAGSQVQSLRHYEDSAQVRAAVAAPAA